MQAGGSTAHTKSNRCDAASEQRGTGTVGQRAAGKAAVKAAARGNRGQASELQARRFVRRAGAWLCSGRAGAAAAAVVDTAGAGEHCRGRASTGKQQQQQQHQQQQQRACDRGPLISLRWLPAPPHHAQQDDIFWCAPQTSPDGGLHGCADSAREGLQVARTSPISEAGAALGSGVVVPSSMASVCFWRSASPFAAPF